MPQKKGRRGIYVAHGVPLALLAVSLILISISTRTIGKLPGAIQSTVFGSVQKAFSFVSDFVEGTLFSIKELSNIRSQYNALADRLEKYSTLEREMADMRSENIRLKEQLGFAENLTNIITSAQIIAKDPGNLYSSIVIDKGSESGVAGLMAATAFQGGVEGLVGKVLKAGRNSSILLPLYDQRFFVSARFSRSRSEGLVNGQGAPDEPLVMRYISKLSAAEVQVGDMVVTSGLDSIYPADMAIGRVKEIRIPEYGGSAIAYLEPVLDFSRLEYLFILKKAPADKPAAIEAKTAEAGK
jgi:rod shape-determining protein MreC